MQDKRNYQVLFTAANAVTATGLLLTVFGSIRLDSVLGFLSILAGRLFDLVDGLVARKTGSSEFGAKLDAVADKLAVLAIVIGAWYFQLLPKWFLIFLIAQHMFVTVLVIIASVIGNPIKVSQMGKNNMFLHMLTLVVFIGASLTSDFWNDALGLLENILAALSVAYGIFTAGDYYSRLRTT